MGRTVFVMKSWNRDAQSRNADSISSGVCDGYRIPKGYMALTGRMATTLFRGISVMEDEGRIADHRAGFAVTDGKWHHIAGAPPRRKHYD